jgi:hypothetical protein
MIFVIFVQDEQPPYKQVLFTICIRYDLGLLCYQKIARGIELILKLMHVGNHSRTQQRTQLHLICPHVP